MKNILSNKILIVTLRLIVGFVFIFSGIEKITNPASFSDAIINYKLFPLFTINFIAIFIPWVELFAGILLLFGIWVKENATIINVLLLLFVIIIAIAMFRGLDISCGCFGTKYAQKVGFQKIGENILLIFFTFVIYKFGGGNESKE